MIFKNLAKKSNRIFSTDIKPSNHMIHLQQASHLKYQGVAVWFSSSFNFQYERMKECIFVGKILIILCLKENGRIIFSKGLMSIMDRVRSTCMSKSIRMVYRGVQSIRHINKEWTAKDKNQVQIFFRVRNKFLEKWTGIASLGSASPF